MRTYVEGIEEVALTMVESELYTFGAKSKAQVLIIDNELPIISIAAVDAVAMEEEDFEGDNLANLVVTRTGDYSSDLTVNYLVSGTAKKTDYRPLSGSVLIPAGEITAEIVIQAVEDNDVEGDEHVVVHISDSTLYNSHPKNVASVLIQDTLPVVTMTLDGADETAEGGSATSVTLTRNDRGGDEIEVNLSITGTANNQSDYVNANRCNPEVVVQ